ncbi:MAG: phosphoglucosamine mutase, partial [Xanthomonadaceae bacterium]|nr:phosphoglucosamine mutase [Xanthomonadaceae bacterium]
AWLTRALGASAGIVISASHNPYLDNGIKFFSAAGEKLDDASEHAIAVAAAAPFVTVAAERLGKAARISDAAERYMAFCRSTVAGDLSLHGLHIVLDCAHGATYQVAPRIFAALGAQLSTIGAEPDGFNINAGVGTMHPGALARAVRRAGADLGIAFDGDGDRVLMVDADGLLADGDDLLYILARDRHARASLRGPVVGTLMSNRALETAIVALGVEFVRADVGDRYVQRALREGGGELGGEASGHLLCLDRATTGDGLVAALAVLEALLRSGETLAAARARLVKLPQRTVNVSAAGGDEVVASPGVRRALAAAEAALAGRGRVLLRPSGTEPLVRVTVEAPDAVEVERVAAGLAAAVTSAARLSSGESPA